MRNSSQGALLRLKAIAGTHVVVLAWDFLGQARPEAFTGDRNLLGFAIERCRYDSTGRLASRHWLRGIKRFQDKDRGMPPGTPVPTSEHPVQTFQWGDYTVEPGTRYEYHLVPVYGEPRNMRLAFDEGPWVRISTESQRATPTRRVRHDIYFNRGVIGSQAYAREFDNRPPDPAAPASAPMRWLSRGLYEALLAYIAQAQGRRFTLRCAFYEFHYPPVLEALAQAARSGAQVRVVFDAESAYRDDNLAAIAVAGLDTLEAVIPRTVREGLRHNKFMVLIEDGQPVSVWTGSTNISAGGIFGHSNVGHVVHDTTVAGAFSDYWERLAANTAPGRLREPNAQASPLPTTAAFIRGTWPVFSPRETTDTPQPSRTLQWYADQAARAQRMVCFTAAFDIAPEFLRVFQADNDVLRYIVKDDGLSAREHLGSDGDVVFAAGGYRDQGAVGCFLEEMANPLNRNDFIHTKYMLVDPLGDLPLVVTGSANFSAGSQVHNDENMLVIRGDTRVADIYFGEFMRLFDHHYARYLLRLQRDRAPEGDDASGYLKPLARDWLPAHFEADSAKEKRRRYFSE